MTEVTETAVTIYQNAPEIISAEEVRRQKEAEAEDAFIERWLKAKCRSQKSRDAYLYVITMYRQVIAEAGLSLSSNNHNALAALAEEFVKMSFDRVGRVKDGQLAEGSINQRISVLSSFFKYAQRFDVVDKNPLDKVDRQPKNVHDAAPALDVEDVQDLLKQIDRSSLPGKRDYALLRLALTTGRRDRELRELTWGKMRFMGRGKKQRCEITWAAKGNKTLRDILGEETLRALLEWLHAFYGKELGSLTNTTPVFVNFSPNPKYYGKALSSQALSDIFEAHGFPRKKHSSRHTFAMTALKAGLDMEELRERMGHTLEATTRAYVEESQSSENRAIGTMESLYGK